ncbi:MAG: NAD-dependent epimerase/dehydratase family protein [Planctomycetales bacterium]|nr:NAD-dependent epimerase/dehydratase family protein [Planctomycetales bacterium]
MPAGSRLIFGCGYLGLRLARRWRGSGDVVYAVTRSRQQADRFGEEGLQPIVADVTCPQTLGDLPACDTVLFAVGFDRHSGRAMREVYVEGLGHVLEALPADCGHFIYISSTGVYGQQDGSWVDEQAVCQPQRAGGQACLEAERLLGRHPRAAEATILRLGGIYGPDRVPCLRDLRAGNPIPSAGDGFLNLIHVEDAVAAVLAAANHPGPLTIYNVTDGHPVLRRDYFAQLAALAGADPVSWTTPPAGSGRQQREMSNKRVENRRMLQALGVELQFPSYREGLAAVVSPA